MNHHGAAFSLCLLAFGALAFAMERHQEDLFGRALPPSKTRALRIAGWSALALALAVVVEKQGWALGLVSYSGHTSVGAGIVFAGLLAYKRCKADRSGR